MQQRPHELMLTDCLKAFGLPDTKATRKHIIASIKPRTLLMPQEHSTQLERLKKSPKSFAPTEEMLNQACFQEALLQEPELATKHLDLLLSKSATLSDTLVIQAIQAHMELDSIAKILSRQPISFQVYLACLALLELRSKDKTFKSWAKKIYEYMSQHALKFVTPVSTELNWLYCFHQVDNFLSVIKTEQLDMYVHRAKTPYCDRLSFSFDASLSLYQQQYLFSPLELAIYFELPPEQLSQLIPSPWLINNLDWRRVQIQQQLKSKDEYCAKLNTTLQPILSSPLKAYLIQQGIYDYQFKSLREHFALPGKFWNQACLPANDSKLPVPEEYSLLWRQVIESDAVIPSVKEAIQSLINTPPKGHMHFETWLYSQANIEQSLMHLAKWQMSFNHLTAPYNNLLFLGICDRKPLSYFKFLFETLNYKIALEEYFNALACFNCFMTPDIDQQWLTDIWEYLKSKSIHHIEPKCNKLYKYHFSKDECALLILDLSMPKPCILSFAMDATNTLKHQTFVIKDIKAIPIQEFSYFFESRFIIEQMNASIIHYGIVSYLQAGNRLDFMKSLLKFNQGHPLLDQFPEYQATLQTPLKMDFGLQIPLTSYLEMQLLEIEQAEKTWVVLTETLNESFHTQVKISPHHQKQGHELTLKYYLETQPQSEHIISSEFKEWLFQQDNATELVLQLMDKGFKLDHDLHHHFSILALAVIHRWPIDIIKSMIESGRCQCSSSDFLTILACLKMHESMDDYSVWAGRTKFYLLENRHQFVYPCPDRSHKHYCFYGAERSLIIHERSINRYYLIQKNLLDSSLKIQHFNLSYLIQREIIFDSPLALAIQFKLPIDVIYLMIDADKLIESPSAPDRHAFFSLLKLKTEDVKYVAEVFGLFLNMFSQLDPDGHTLLHFLVKHDRADLLHEYARMLRPLIDEENRFKQTPVNRQLNCSKKTFEQLINYNPKHLDLETLYQLMLEPKYTADCLKWLRQNPIQLKNTLPSGLTLMQELFAQGKNIIPILKMIVDTHSTLLDHEDKQHLLTLHITKAVESESFLHLLDTFKLQLTELPPTCFIQASLVENWKLARLLSNPEFIAMHIASPNAHPQFFEFIIKQLYIKEHPELLPLILNFLNHHPDTIYALPLLRQIWSIARAQTQWLSDFDGFPHLLRLVQEHQLIHSHELLRGGETLVYYVERYCHQHQNYELAMTFDHIDINQKNQALEHIIVSLFKQDNGLKRVIRLIDVLDHRPIQFINLNAKGDSFLDLTIESQNDELINWFFENHPKIAAELIKEDIQKKHSQLITLFRKNRKLFDLILTHITDENLGHLQDIAHKKMIVDLKNHLQQYKPQVSVAQASQAVFTLNWEELVEFLNIATAKQILNLPVQFKTNILPKLIEEHGVLPLFQQLKSKPRPCMQAFCKIKYISSILQDVADRIEESDDLFLFNKLQASLPPQISLKKRFANWQDLKNLVDETPELAFRLLKDAKLELFLTDHPAIELINIVLNKESRFFEKLMSYPAIQSRLPEILKQAYETQHFFLISVIRPFLPLELRALKRLHVMANSSVITEVPQAKCHANSLLALNLFRTQDQTFAAELERRQQQAPRVFVNAAALPSSLHQLFERIKPRLQPKHQYLGLFGSSVRHLYNKKPHQSDYDCFAVLTCSLEDIYQDLKSMNMGHMTLVNSSKPVLRMSIPNHHGQPTEIDLCAFELDLTIEPDVAIDQELQKHDFSISGAYLLINNQASYPICGTEQVLTALFEKKLSLMAPNRLDEDPLRLMRAIKIQLDDCQYQPDAELMAIIESKRPQHLLGASLNKELHCRQLVTQLYKFLNSPEQQLESMELMERYHVFETWTGLKMADIREQLQHLPPINPIKEGIRRLQLVFYFYIVAAQQQASFEAFKSTPIYQVSRVFVGDKRLFFNFIDSQLWEQDFDMFIDGSDILNLIDHAKKYQASIYHASP